MSLKCHSCGEEHNFMRIWEFVTVEVEVDGETGMDFGHKQIASELKHEDSEIECIECGARGMIEEVE